MPKESNYFEESVELFGDPDPIMARTAKALYREAFRRYQAEGFKPCDGFNIRYFYESVSRVLRAGHVRDAAHATLGCSTEWSIRAVNIPTDVGSSIFARKYIELVTAESVPDGDEFDVRYVVEVAASAFTAEALEWILNPEPLEDPFEPVANETSDEWLAGFNKQ